jgi:hypothetical protein
MASSNLNTPRVPKKKAANPQGGFLYQLELLDHNISPLVMFGGAGMQRHLAPCGNMLTLTVCRGKNIL